MPDKVTKAEIQQWDEETLQTIREAIWAIEGLIAGAPPEMAEQMRQKTNQRFIELGVDDHFYIQPPKKPN